MVLSINTLNNYIHQMAV